MSRKAGVTRYANHPIVKFVRALDGEFYLTREVAEMVGITQRTLAQIVAASPTPMGATHKAQYGGTILHLYTPERIAEIAEFYRTKSGHDKGNKPKRRPAWTHTEFVERRRGMDRARQYRRRAIRYRAAGNEKEALRMDKMSAALLAKLEKLRVKREAELGRTPSKPKKQG